MCLRKADKLLDSFLPETMILEEARSLTNRSDRINRLYKVTVAPCQASNIGAAI